MGKRDMKNKTPPSGAKSQSLVLRLNTRLFFRQLGIFLCMDLLLVVLALMGQLMWAEKRCADVAQLVQERGVPTAEAVPWMAASDYTIIPLDREPKGVDVGELGWFSGGEATADGLRTYVLFSYYTVELPNGTDLDNTEEVVWEVLYRLQEVPEADLVYASVGGGMLSSGTSSASVTMNLVDKAERTRSTSEVCKDVQDMLSDIPGAEITATASSSAMGSFGGADISFNVYGYDSQTLMAVEDDLVQLLSSTPGFTDVEGSTGDTVPEAKVVIDRSKASLYGITTASIASSLNTAISGSTATQYKVDGTEIDVVIRYDTDKLNFLTDLNNLTVTSAYGGEIPLSSIATVEMGESATAINRENQKNYITISASADGMSGGEAQKLVDQILAGYTFPDGCTYGYSGTLEMMNDAFSSLLTALVVAVLLVYMIMASQFESIRYPMIIMVSMPLAFTGAILGLFLTGNTITMTSMMGFIMLAGMVVNNGIVLIDYTNQLMDRGMRCYDALTTAGPRRLRPILMTTLTTILGMLPLVFSQQEGSEMMRTMAISVIFGLTLSSLVTLVFIPVLYAWMNSRKERRLEKKAAKRAAKEAKNTESIQG